MRPSTHMWANSLLGEKRLPSSFACDDEENSSADMGSNDLLCVISGGPRLASSSLSGLSSQALTFLGGARVYYLAPEAPLLWDYRRVRSVFRAVRRVWVTALRSDPAKKGLVPHSSGRWDARQIFLYRLAFNRTLRLTTKVISQAEYNSKKTKITDFDIN